MTDLAELNGRLKEIGQAGSYYTGLATLSAHLDVIRQYVIELKSRVDEQAIEVMPLALFAEEEFRSVTTELALKLQKNNPLISVDEIWDQILLAAQMGIAIALEGETP